MAKTIKIADEVHDLAKSCANRLGMKLYAFMESAIRLHVERQGSQVAAAQGPERTESPRRRKAS